MLGCLKFLYDFQKLLSRAEKQNNAWDITHKINNLVFFLGKTF